MQTPSRREFLSAVGITSAIVAYDTLVARGEEKLLPLEELDKSILDKIEHARKSIVMLEIYDNNGEVLGKGSGFILKEPIEKDGKKLKRVVTAKHVASRGAGVIEPSGEKTSDPILSEDADTAIMTVDGLDDIEGLEITKSPIKGQEVIIMEPKFLRDGGVAMSRNEIGTTIIDKNGFPPIRTFVKKILSSTEKMLLGLNDGEVFQMEHFVTQGASGSPILTIENGEVKVCGVLTGYSVCNVMSADGKNTICETDTYATSSSEITKLLNGK
jgi:hypothetical protein